MFCCPLSLHFPSDSSHGKRFHALFVRNSIPKMLCAHLFLAAVRCPIADSFIKFGLKLRKLWRRVSPPPPPSTERRQKSLDWIGLSCNLASQGYFLCPICLPNHNTPTDNEYLREMQQRSQPTLPPQHLLLLLLAPNLSFENTHQ